MAEIDVKRVYDDPDGDDGFRVYVDRLWPRGESKEKFHYDLWAKDAAPSTELREWFHADPEGRWTEFEKRYTAELDAAQSTRDLIDRLAPHDRIVLLFSSRDTMHNNAVVLSRYLRGKL